MPPQNPPENQLPPLPTDPTAPVTPPSTFGTPPQQPRTQGYTPPPVYSPTANTGSGSKLPLIIGIIVGLLVLGSGGVLVGKSLLGHKSTKTTSSGIEGLGGEKTIDKQAKVGQTADLSGLAITVGSIEKKTELDKYTVADNGKIFVVAAVSVKNGLSEKLDDPAYEFTLTTGKGEIVDSHSAYPLKDLSTGIAPGGESSGFVVFEISTSDTIKTVNFEHRVTPANVAKDRIIYKAEFTQ